MASVQVKVQVWARRNLPPLYEMGVATISMGKLKQILITRRESLHLKSVKDMISS